MPTAPIAPREEATVVATARELIVWGGASDGGTKFLADGAAYSPAAGTWVKLPPSPLSPRKSASAVWTGSLLIVWGGSTGAQTAAGDGAAYDPATNSWSMLPAAPLSARVGATAAWVGGRIVVLGGQPALISDAARSYSDGAAYDPTTHTWTALPPAPQPEGHPLAWTTTVATGESLLAWTVWDASKPLGGGGVEISTGSDLLRYEPSTNRWTVVPPAPHALGSVGEALWTGKAVVARGLSFYCGPRPCPYQPDTTSRYDPNTNTWTVLPADPLRGTGALSTWIDGQLLSVDGAGIFGTVKPGDATSYDPNSDTWSHQPPAPFGCNSSEQTPTPIADVVLYYCPAPTTGAGAGHDGLMFTATD